MSTHLVALFDTLNYFWFRLEFQCSGNIYRVLSEPHFELAGEGPPMYVDLPRCCASSGAVLCPLHELGGVL